MAPEHRRTQFLPAMRAEAANAARAQHTPAAGRNRRLPSEGQKRRADGRPAEAPQDNSGPQAGSLASVGVTIWRSLKPAMSIWARREE